MRDAHPTVSCRNIPDFPGYRASETGIIQSCWCRSKGTSKESGGWGLGPHWRTLYTFPDPRGYRRVNLNRYGKIYHFTVHRLILITFIGPCPDGMQACHNNGNHLDNRLTNLRWDTPESNEADIVKHGRRPIGSKFRFARLTEEDIPEIRRLHASGLTYIKISQIYDVHFTTIALAITGKTWKHVPS